MKILRWLLMGLLAMGLCAGCEDDDGDGGGGGLGGSVAGSWSGGGAYDQGTIISQFNLDLTQDGNAVSGSYSIERTGRSMSGSISGTVSGNSIDMDFIPHGNASGTVSGNSMSLNWWEDGFGGEGGGGSVTLSR